MAETLVTKFRVPLTYWCITTFVIVSRQIKQYRRSMLPLNVSENLVESNNGEFQSMSIVYEYFSSD